MEKRKTMCILAMFVCIGVFADSPLTVTVDTAMDAFYIRSFTGDYSFNRPLIAGSPFKYQGEGDITGFQSSLFDDGLNGRVNLSYSGNKLGGFLQLRANTDSMVKEDWEWEAWLRPVQWFRIAAGNLGRRGQVERYHHFDDFLSTKIDSLGVLYPSWQTNPPYSAGNNFDTRESFPWGYDAPGQNKGFAKFATTDTNDLFTLAGETSRLPLNLLLDIEFVPVTVSASLGGLFSSLSRPFLTPWSIGEKERAIDYDNEYEPVLSNKTNFGFRVECAEIAGMINIAAVYKYADALLSKPSAFSSNDLIKETIGNHAFGLYTTVTPVTGLGISAGYSGQIRTWENPFYKSTVVENTLSSEDANKHYHSLYREVGFPFYSGIDLRFSYNGGERLAVTLNNNVSFAEVKGTDNRVEKYADSWVYYGELNANAAGVADRSESYLGLYNALGIKYAITDDLLADFQIANQHGIFTLNWEKDPVKSVTNYLGLYTGVNFTVVESAKIRASIRGGVALKLSSYSYQNAVTAETHKAGILDLGIPLGVKVEF